MSSKTTKVSVASLKKARWFGSKSRKVTGVKTLETFDLGEGAALTVVEVTYGDALGPKTERYMAGDLSGNEADALAELFLMAAEHGPQGEAIGLMGSAGGILRVNWSASLAEAKKLVTLPAAPLGVEQSNTSFKYAERAVVKIYRKVVEGVNPDVEVTLALTLQNRFKGIAATLGWVEYTAVGAKGPSVIAHAQTFVKSKGDAWRALLGEIEVFCKKIKKAKSADVADFVRWSQLLGERTREMHEALGKFKGEAFLPEKWQATDLVQKKKAVQKQAKAVLSLLNEHHRKFKGEAHLLAAEVLGAQSEIKAAIEAAGKGAGVIRVQRVHGDFHMGQVMFTGKDFVMLDFEGEPTRSAAERRAKHPVEKDIAGMLRSFHYAAQAGLADKSEKEREELGPVMDLWFSWVSAGYLEGYFGSLGKAKRSQPLLALYLLEKALYELNYEINHRPDWAAIPLKGILQLLEGAL